MGEPSVKEEINGLLAGETHATSTHVEREWKRIVEGGCAAVLNAFRDGEAGLDEVLPRLSQAGFGRSTGQALRVLSLLLSGNGYLGPDASIRARRLIRVESRVLFRTGIDEIRDGSQCGLARETTTPDSSGRYELKDRCKKTESICRQDAFLDPVAGELRTVGDALVRNSPADRKRDTAMGKTALAMANDRSQRKGKNCYGVVGDVSIALECRSDEVILTTDRSVEVIAPALGLNFHRLQPTGAP